jgi:hypothetical protein
MQPASYIAKAFSIGVSGWLRQGIVAGRLSVL